MEPGGSLRLAGINVLLVDDDEASRHLLVYALMRNGATVVGVASAREALAMLQRERPDVLVSEVSMPGEDGYWLIRRVRALPMERGGATPAAGVTGHTRADDRARLLRAGFNFHVPKPVDPVQLIGVVAVLALKE